MVHGEAVPLLDGNIARVGARVLALAADPRKTAGRKAILEWVRGLMNDAPPGQVNEALMELGATICTPTRPGLRGLPARTTGVAPAARASPTAYPPPKATRSTIDLRWLAVLIEDPAGRWLLRQVTEGPILRGLWLPPFVEIDQARALEIQALELLPFEPSSAMEFSKPVKHSITHRRIEVTPARARIDHPVPASEGWSWVDPAAPNLPTSSLLAKLVAAVS